MNALLSTISDLDSGSNLDHMYRRNLPSDERAECERWAAELWKSAEDPWINRDGQDHFYRKSVIIPALLRQIEYFSAFKSIVDLGCGDGYMLELLLRSSQIDCGAEPRLLLIDRSKAQLDVAHSRFRNLSRNFTVIQSDLHSIYNCSQIVHAPSPRLFLGIFVMNELISLAAILSGLHMYMRRDDILLCIVVDPRFAETLVTANPNITTIFESAYYKGKDWEWAVPYPISSTNGTIYLPYFHRSISGYCTHFYKSAMHVCDAIKLYVPDSPEARSCFIDTDYGLDIIDRPSSVLLVIRNASITRMSGGIDG